MPRDGVSCAVVRHSLAALFAEKRICVIIADAICPDRVGINGFGQENKKLV